MTIETVDLLQVRPGVDEDERRDHGGVSSLGSSVGGTLTSTNHYHLPVPAHTGDILTSLDYPNLIRQHSVNPHRINTGVKLGVSSPCFYSFRPQGSSV